MSAEIEKLKEKKGELTEKVLGKDEKLVDLALELTLEELEGKGCPENEEGWFCPEMIEGAGHLVAERVPLVLEVLHEEGHLERKVSVGIPHYRLKE